MSSENACSMKADGTTSRERSRSPSREAASSLSRERSRSPSREAASSLAPFFAGTEVPCYAVKNGRATSSSLSRARFLHELSSDRPDERFRVQRGTARRDDQDDDVLLYRAKSALLSFALALPNQVHISEESVRNRRPGEGDAVEREDPAADPRQSFQVQHSRITPKNLSIPSEHVDNSPRQNDPPLLLTTPDVVHLRRHPRHDPPQSGSTSIHTSLHRPQQHPARDGNRAPLPPTGVRPPPPVTVFTHTPTDTSYPNPPARKLKQTLGSTVRSNSESKNCHRRCTLTITPYLYYSVDPVEMSFVLNYRLDLVAPVPLADWQRIVVGPGIFESPRPSEPGGRVEDWSTTNTSKQLPGPCPFSLPKFVHRNSIDLQTCWNDWTCEFEQDVRPPEVSCNNSGRRQLCGHTRGYHADTHESATKITVSRAQVGVVVGWSLFLATRGRARGRGARSCSCLPPLQEVHVVVTSTALSQLTSSPRSSPQSAGPRTIFPGSRSTRKRFAQSSVSSRTPCNGTSTCNSRRKRFV